APKTSSSTCSSFTVCPSRFLTSTVAISAGSSQLSVICCPQDRSAVSDRRLLTLLFLSADCILPTSTYGAPWPCARSHSCLEGPGQRLESAACSPLTTLAPRADSVWLLERCPYGRGRASPS